jgi:hypothetical protein
VLDRNLSGGGFRWFFKQAEEQRKNAETEAYEKDGLGDKCRPVEYASETKNRGDKRDNQASGSTS